MFHKMEKITMEVVRTEDLLNWSVRSFNRGFQPPLIASEDDLRFQGSSDGKNYDGRSSDIGFTRCKNLSATFC